MDTQNYLNRCHFEIMFKLLITYFIRCGIFHTNALLVLVPITKAGTNPSVAGYK